jgi:hypothetical protein
MSIGVDPAVIGCDDPTSISLIALYDCKGVMLVGIKPSYPTLFLAYELPIGVALCTNPNPTCLSC